MEKVVEVYERPVGGQLVSYHTHLWDLGLENPYLLSVVHLPLPAATLGLQRLGLKPPTSPGTVGALSKRCKFFWIFFFFFFFFFFF